MSVRAPAGLPVKDDHRLDPVLHTVRKQERSRSLLFCAAIVPLFFLSDWLANQEPPLGPLLVRLAWAATLASCALLVRRVSDRTYPWLQGFVAVSSSIYYLAVAELTGGSTGALFAWSLALPLATTAILQDDTPAVVAGTACTLLGGSALLVTDHRPPEAVALWATLYVASGAVGVFSSMAYRRFRQAESAVERERVRVLEQLASSEHRRAHSERLALLGQLATGMAHEIKNPLTLAVLHLSLLREPPLRDPEQAARVERIKAALDRIAAITSDMQTYGRGEDEEIRDCALQEFLDPTLRLAEFRLRQVEVEQNLPSDLPQVRVNPRHMSQVLLNLLVNAADALDMREGGEPPWVRLSAAEENGWLKIILEDNGPGIPSQVMSRLFEPFVTTKPAGQGTGLGLALSREYVERFGGKLQAENRPEGGARFIVQLPAARGSA